MITFRRFRNATVTTKMCITKRSPLFSHEKIEIIEIYDASEGQTEKHYWIAGRMEDDAHDHWPQTYS